MSPQRSNRCMTTVSNSRRLVIGEVISPCSCRRRGKRRSRAASGARVALIWLGQLHHLSALYVPATFTFGFTCHVTRRLLLNCWPSLTAGVVVGTYSHSLGLKALAFVKMPASFFTELYRVENQNHTLSRLIGPPNASLKSKLLTIFVGVGIPAARRSSEKLSPCRPCVAKAKNAEFANWLPPSRGMKLIRTPPVGRSAESEVVSIETSAAEPTSGVWPPMLPPACSVIVLMPLAVTR